MGPIWGLCEEAKERKGHCAGEANVWASIGIAGHGPSSPGLAGLFGSKSAESCWATALGSAKQQIKGLD